MQWWSNFLNWAESDGGAFVLTSIAVPAASIIVAGLLAAWIASGAIRRLLASRDRELKVSVIGALVDAAQQASVWNSLTPQEQVLSDRATGQADIQVRLLPIKGSAVAADWAAHSLAEMKRSSATFGYQVEPAVVHFRDELVQWQHRPGRTRRSFQADLDRWQHQSTDTERTLQEQQEAWVAQQHHEQYAPPARSAEVRAGESRVTESRAADARPAEPRTAAPRAAESLLSKPTPPPATTGTLDTQRVLNDVDALERQIEAGAGR